MNANSEESGTSVDPESVISPNEKIYAPNSRRGTRLVSGHASSRFGFDRSSMTAKCGHVLDEDVPRFYTEAVESADAPKEIAAMKEEKDTQNNVGL